MSLFKVFFGALLASSLERADRLEDKNVALFSKCNLLNNTPLVVGT